MAREDPRLGRYRRFLMVFALAAGVVALTVGGVFLSRGKVFPAFLALCVLAFLMLLVRGYAEDERERQRGNDK